MTNLANQIEVLSAAANGFFDHVDQMIAAERALNGRLRDNLPQIVAALNAQAEVEALRARVAELSQTVAIYACECANPDRCHILDREDCGWQAQQTIGGVAARRKALKAKP